MSTAINPSKEANMSRFSGAKRLIYTRDTRRLLSLVFLAYFGALSNAFTVHHPSSLSTCSRTKSIQHQPFHPSHNTKTQLYMAPKRSGPDEAEWRALLKALQMYKAAFGDLKVPTRFIVPGMPPWPGTSTFCLLLLFHYMSCSGSLFLLFLYH